MAKDSQERGPAGYARREYEEEMRRRTDAVFRANSQLGDHRGEYAWVTGWLGDPFAPVWFVAENPSLGQAQKLTTASEENQWAVSAGDRLFRRLLTKHGFKEGEADAPGGWRCYITDVIKSAAHAEKWNRLGARHHRDVAETWAPMLAWELEQGKPRIVVSVGKKADRLLTHLERSRLIPRLPERMLVAHYSYIAMRPDARRRLGPGHPDRVAEYDEEFEAVARARTVIRASRSGEETRGLEVLPEPRPHSSAGVEE